MREMNNIELLAEEIVVSCEESPDEIVVSSEAFPEILADNIQQDAATTKLPTTREYRHIRAATDKPPRYRLKTIVVLMSLAGVALVAIVGFSQQLFTHHLHAANYPGWPNRTSWSEILGVNVTRQPISGRNIQFRRKGQDRGQEQDTGIYQETVLDQEMGQDLELVMGQDGQQHVDLVEDDIFWSPAVENQLRRRWSEGPSAEDPDLQVLSLRDSPVAGMEQVPVGTSLTTQRWCGGTGSGERNRLLVLNDGTMACARYRDPRQQLVLGEVLTSHLARLLGIPGVAPAVLSQVFSSSDQWIDVAVNITAADWREGTIVSLTPWMDNLARTPIPLPIRQVLFQAARSSSSSSDSSRGSSSSSSSDSSSSSSERNNANSSGGGSGSEVSTISGTATEDQVPDIAPATYRLTLSEAAELAVWSDLIVLDYLTANYDRVAAMLDSVQREDRWAILNSTVPNMGRSRRGGQLWLVENESGLVDAYNLLYPGAMEVNETVDEYQRSESAKFQWIQRLVLTSVCVFRRSTVTRVNLMVEEEVGGASHLLEKVGEAEPLLAELERRVGRQIHAFKDHFQVRLGEVRDWMEECRHG